ncbi:unnamed protein product [Cuscuta epithymum]|uniref:Cathepsin propeptide inhibitor domain-containing protein n=1 Tax=Cuscuta epithymum TaxID=186058 RepID=A0AAV0D099_9ASTE|nr:unnamed protein product [Cuscuta epithymum]
MTLNKYYLKYIFQAAFFLVLSLSLSWRCRAAPDAAVPAPAAAVPAPAAAVSAPVAAPAEEAEFPVEKLFEEWMVLHGRSYKDEAEKAKRFENFKKTKEYVDAFNKRGNETYTLGLNGFSDMTVEEFTDKYLRRTTHCGRPAPPRSNIRPSPPAPDTARASS